MAILDFYDSLTSRLRSVGDYIWPTALRVILWWEFWEAGVQKYLGENWFASIPYADWQKGFPFPFSLMSTNINWLAATWGELILSAMLLVGLFTRFAAFSLIVLTAVATAAVHWPAEYDGLAGLWEGYAITAKGAGNFKLPLLFIIMLLPLVFYGGGKISVDQMLINITGRRDRLDERTRDWQGLGLALFILAFAVIWLEPVWGGALLLGSALALLAPQFMDN